MTDIHEALHDTAHNMRVKKAALTSAKSHYDTAVDEFKRQLSLAYPDGERASFVANDGYKYGRTYAEVGGGLDYERLKRENMDLALMIGRLVVDPEAVERVVEKFPAVLPKLQAYALPTTQQERLLPITKPKQEEEDD